MLDIESGQKKEIRIPVKTSLAGGKGVLSQSDFYAPQKHQLGQYRSCCGPGISFYYSREAPILI
jgi:hypothetical protein